MGWRAVCACVVVSGCVDSVDRHVIDQQQQQEIIEVGGETDIGDGIPRSMYVVQPVPQVRVSPVGASTDGDTQSDPGVAYAATTTIYMNRHGGTFTPGIDDSSMGARSSRTAPSAPMIAADIRTTVPT